MTRTDEARVVHTREPFNAETPRRTLGERLTPVESFYVRNHGPVPQAGDEPWRLRVDGLVERPLDLVVEDLARRWESVTVEATLQCAGNRRTDLFAVQPVPGELPWGPGAISTASWTGVRLADVLAEAGLHPQARHIEMVAPDVAEDAEPPRPFGGSVPVAKACAPEVLLAWQMNGEPLPALHGGPLRVVVPGWIGARSVKWVERVTALAEPSCNHFQDVAYRLLAPHEKAGPGRGHALGPSGLVTEIVAPGPGARVPAGPLEVTGYAYVGGGRSVLRVDVSADAGESWTVAELAEAASPWSWRHWRAVVDLPTGEHELVARAWDDAGGTQPESPRHVWNPKGYVSNAWSRVPVTVEG